MPLKRLIPCLDVDRDGTLEGVDPRVVADASAAAGEAALICSGGIASLADLAALFDLALPNLEGVIVGKALYEERFTVREAQGALTGRSGLLRPS